MSGSLTFASMQRWLGSMRQSPNAARSHARRSVVVRSGGSLALSFLSRHARRRQMALRRRQKQCAGRLRADGLSYRQTQKRNPTMAETVKVWFDKEGDFLEVRFSEKPGFMRE